MTGGRGIGIGRDPGREGEACAARRLAPSGARAASAALLAGLLVLATGACATKGDVRDLRQEMVEEMRAMRAEQDSTAAALRSQNRELMDSLQTASELLLRIRGDLGSQLLDLEQQLIQVQELTGQSQRRLTEMRDELERRSDQLEQAAAREAAAGRGAGGETGGEGAELYTIGMEHMDRSASQTARSAFQQIVENHPEHERAPDAQFQIGETYAQEGRYDDALSAFERVLELYPNSTRAPSALYRAGVISEERGNIERAREYFQRVVRGYPDSDAADQARQRLESSDG